MEMNGAEQYIANSIRIDLWSGFYSLDDFDSLIEDIMEPEADEQVLREYAELQWRSKREAEAAWPAETDCDRLDQACASLNAQGVISLQNAGMTMSEGHTDVAEEYANRPEASGYCFYHRQDLEGAVDGGGVMFAFGDMDNTSKGKIAIGKKVRAELESFGFEVIWNGDAETRLDVPHFVWRRRFVGK